jgi:alanine racemase
MILTDAWPQQRAWVEIDLHKLAHNVGQLRSLLAPGIALMAVVKADAYGHGSIEVAKTVLAAGATWLAVATVPEGIELREAGIDAPILLLGAANSFEQIELIVEWGLQPSIVSLEQAQYFQEHLVKPIDVHLKVDTGMSRLGIPWEKAVDCCRIIRQFPKLQIASIYSHLATPDELDSTILDLQEQRFSIIAAEIKPLFDRFGDRVPFLHLANSAGLLVGQHLHHDLVRPGLALYGLCPAPHLGNQLGLQPVMSVKARVTQVKTISAGTGVSYGHRFVAQRDTTIAVVGIGYADGVPRLLSGQLELLLHGQRVRQIGNITMDQIMLDITDLSADSVRVKVNDVATLLGEVNDQKITADDWANLLGTISWEILCGFKHRLPRILV